MKVFSKITTAVAVIITLSLVVSCSGKGGKSLKGTNWEYTEENELGATAGGYISFTTDTDFSTGMILNEDHSELYSGTYTSDGKTVTFTVFDENSKGTINGDKLTYDGQTYTKK